MDNHILLKTVCIVYLTMQNTIRSSALVKKASVTVQHKYMLLKTIALLH